MSYELVRLYRGKYPEWAEREMDAQREANERVESALFVNATEKGNVVAQQVWLYNRAPDRWTDKRAAAAGQAVLDLTKLSDDELATLARLTAKAGRGGDPQADAPTVVEGK